ncbi:hypothetical protein FE257_011157 [Aspergillus nanangensis]|uniref:RZ-type domain-containing protein n=1 Tax=Aspergillus nanangensis TaxID=2582783 RepID=A0AAD4GRQ0_ASPNN|nr:hypothetical protein FE257_011157 [Aspergillus nanangensis]
MPDFAWITNVLANVKLCCPVATIASSNKCGRLYSTVAIPDARRDAQNRVPHVQCQNACLPALTAHARCPVRHPVTIFHALSVVRKCYPVATSAHLIKATQVDFILGEVYHEVDLTENPCIFPQCGHFLTIESMDAQMDIKKHYILNEHERPVSIASSSQPFSINDIRTCAICRGSLRNISRYGRLVRRALLDEATKKFILYLNQEYVPMAQDLSSCILQLRNHEGGARAKETAGQVFHADAKIRIEGPPEHQVRVMGSLVSRHDKERWKQLLALRGKISTYKRRVQVEEQPFNRVHNMVEDARRRRKTPGQFDFDANVLQTKGHLQATSLLLRLDAALLADFLSLRQQVQPSTIRSDLYVNLAECKKESRRLIANAASSHRILQEVEGKVFLAQFCALERQSLSEPAQAEVLLQEGTAAIEQAERLCSLHSSQTRGLSEEIDGTKAMLRGSAFYTPVTNEERMAVIEAMTREFRGTGHWYYCGNGHPFTIGECGGAMELARCPECGAAVGGQNHRTTAGVTRADDLENALGGMHL